MHRSYGSQYSTSTQDAYQLELLRQSYISEQRLRDFERYGNNRRRRRQMQHDAEDFNNFVGNGEPQPQQQSRRHTPYAEQLPLTLNELMRHEALEHENVYSRGPPLHTLPQHQQQQEEMVIDPVNVVRNLSALGRFLELLQRWPLPRFSLTTACVFFLLAIFITPRTIAQSIIFPAFRLLFGFLHPAYASYKAVRTKHMKEYVKWMMYWIVFALFSCVESVTDIFISWLPFYYEVKVILVLWLLSPATHGSSTLYRKFVHPALERREEEIDKYLNEAKERGYSAVLQLGSKGVNYATNVIMQTALKGGGNLVQTLKRSYSLSDLSEPDVHRTQDEIDQVVALRPQQRMLRPRHQTAVGRSGSGTRHSTGMYFTEVDISKGGAAAAGDINYNIRSSEDISSGYSSAEPLSAGLSRTSSMTNATRARSKGKRPEEKHMSSSCTTLPRSKKMEKPVSSLTSAKNRTK